MGGVPRRVAGTARRHTSRSVLALASDERLTREMRAGNEAAFETAYARYAPGLLTLCRHILGSADEAEEAVQHAFAAAWSQLQRTDRPAPEALKPWLYAIARHRCLSLLRRRSPRTLPLHDVPSTSGLADEVGRRADLSALLADVRDLPEEQRTALVLSEIAGLSHGDIADVLGRRESGIKALVFQARVTLGDWREARDARCDDIRQQLSVLRGGSLRRRALRRHLQRCPACRAFRADVKAQRRRLGLVLPALPSVGLKRGVLAAAGLGPAGGAAGGGLSLGTASLVPLGSLAAATVTAAGLGAIGASPPDEPQSTRKDVVAANRAPVQSRSPALVPTRRLLEGAVRRRARRSKERPVIPGAAASRENGVAATPPVKARATSRGRADRSQRARPSRGQRDRAQRDAAKRPLEAVQRSPTAKRQVLPKRPEPRRQPPRRGGADPPGQAPDWMRPCTACPPPPPP